MKVNKIVKKQRSKNELEELVQSLAWNDGYGCYTRAGFEKIIWPEIAKHAKWIIFFDVDDMHDLNDQHGYEGVNALIKKSLGAVRESDYVAGQWQSGDEVLVCITEDGSRESSLPTLLCERLASEFSENGVPATFGIAPVTSKNLSENVVSAYELVQAAKREGRRGSINMAGGK